MNPIETFNLQKKKNIEGLKNPILKKLSSDWLEASFSNFYPYNFNWCGIPIIQYPQDIIAMQEIIWETKPDIIIETGVAHGGSIIFYSSMIELLGNKGKVIGVDIDIRKHNLERMQAHPLFKNVVLMEGSSIDKAIVDQIKEFIKPHHKVLVALDSYHTHEHVLEELKLYSPLVSTNSYLVVFDTLVEKLNDENFLNRPWKKGNNPQTAVDAFLKTTSRFQIDEEIHTKLLITANFNGYLKAVTD